jgi:outer membrane lipoprotein-sorting protein
MQALLVTLASEVAKAEATAAAAAAAVGQANPPPDAARAAQTAQGAAAALQDLSAAVKAALGDGPTVPVRRDVTRVIELRGRNLSDQALFSIDQAELPFRMLRPTADGKQQPEVVIREKNDPNLAVVLRLTIDAARLEEPDLRQYRVWFGAPSAKPKTFSIINLDGQRAEISFSVPPATAQKPTDTVGQTK